jgi:ABC-type ATPase involved in cell division
MTEMKGNLIELFDCEFAPIGEGNGLRQFHFKLSEGDICVLNADLPDDGHLFLRALATLDAPVQGCYFFRGTKLDFSDYRNLLPFRKRIGYITPDSALLVNRSIQENIMLMHAYFDDVANYQTDIYRTELCSRFRIHDKLDLRPAQVDREDLRLALITRELLKFPDFLIIERPRDYLSPEKFSLFTEVLQERIRSGLPIVLLSSDEAFVTSFEHLQWNARRDFRIENGLLISE